jgi:hypothetical protein
MKWEIVSWQETGPSGTVTWRLEADGTLSKLSASGFTIEGSNGEFPKNNKEIWDSHSVTVSTTTIDDIGNNKTVTHVKGTSSPKEGKMYIAGRGKDND